MPFTYPFETLLNMKKNLEELSHIRLGKKIHELREEEEEINRIAGEILASHKMLGHKMKHRMNASEYILYMNYHEDQEILLRVKEEAKEKTEGEIEAEKKVLIQLVKERKMLERLKEKQWKRFQYRMEKLDQKENDEMVITRLRTSKAKSPDVSVR